MNESTPTTKDELIPARIVVAHIRQLQSTLRQCAEGADRLGEQEAYRECLRLALFLENNILTAALSEQYSRRF